MICDRLEAGCFRIGRHVEHGDAELVQMRLPRRRIDEVPIRMLGLQPDDRPGERAAAHIGERLGVDR